jgi:wyosine [tRNA(Phe)-imidazoG37] synthetase (radical SAM superfamily)
MSGILFHELVFGPVRSRRLGYSLGVNLLPVNSKICSFNCIYCECGWNPTVDVQGSFASTSDLLESLERRLKELNENNQPLDSITFAGNGEPTLHPEFGKIVDGVVTLRNNYFPNVMVSVLTNSTGLWNDSVFNALMKVDMPILKMDSAIGSSLRAINKTSASFDEQLYYSGIARMKGKMIIQTMLLRGMHDGTLIDNTSEEEWEAYLKRIKEFDPVLIMLYSLDRTPPASGLEKIPDEKIRDFADRLRSHGFKVQAV